MNAKNQKLESLFDQYPALRGKFIGYKKDRDGLGISRIDNDWYECEDYLISISDFIEWLDSDPELLNQDDN